jgi:hypothetical protein
MAVPIGYKHTEESKKKISLSQAGSGNSMFGVAPWNKGKKRPEITGEKSSRWGKHHTKEVREKLRLLHLGKPLSEETRRKLSKIHKGKQVGKDNPMWLGGKSFEPYGLGFNNKLREQTRARDNYECKECGFNQGLLKQKLHIHHIDYDKRNNKPENLISLCRSCHMQTNFKRKDWTDYFNSRKTT